MGSPANFVSKAPAWLVCQLIGKPFGQVYFGTYLQLAGLLVGGGRATDTVDEQKWWTLKIEGRPSPWQSTAGVAADQDAVWAASSPNGGGTTTARTRQWAELALWYPALSPAAGATSLTNLNALPLGNVELPPEVSAMGRNIDFTTIGGEGGWRVGGLSLVRRF